MKNINNFVRTCAKILVFGAIAWMVALIISHEKEMFSLVTSMSGVAITALFVGATAGALVTFIVMQLKFNKLITKLKNSKANLKKDFTQCKNELNAIKSQNNQYEKHIALLNTQLTTMRRKGFKVPDEDSSVNVSAADASSNPDSNALTLQDSES